MTDKNSSGYHASAIYNTAKTLISQYGYNAMNVSMIADNMPFQQQNIYNYYSSKEAILIDILNTETQRWLDCYEQAQGSKTSTNVMHHYLSILFEQLDQGVIRFIIMLINESTVLPEKALFILNDFITDWLTQIEELCEESRGFSSQRLCAQTILSVFCGVYTLQPIWESLRITQPAHFFCKIVISNVLHLVLSVDH